MIEHQSNTSTKLVFFGNEQLATGYTADNAPIFNALIKSGYQIKALILKQKLKSVDDLAKLSVVRIAQSHNIQVICVENDEQLLRELAKIDADCGVLASFGKIVSRKILESFPMGIINIHPSLLPLYRGPTPIEQALLDDATATGVSIIQLGEQMDAGPVFMQEEVQIRSNESKIDLAERLASLGAKILEDHLDGIIAGHLKPKLQDETKATYCNLISKQDGLIDTHKTAQALTQEIRAYAGWPKSTFRYNGMQLIIIEAVISQQNVHKGKLEIRDEKLLLGCKDSALEVTNLQIAGKKPMDAKSFMNGYKSMIKA